MRDESGTVTQQKIVSHHRTYNAARYDEVRISMGRTEQEFTVEHFSLGPAEGGDRNYALALDLALTENLHGRAGGGSGGTSCITYHGQPQRGRIMSGFNPSVLQSGTCCNRGPAQNLRAEGRMADGAKADAAAAPASIRATRFAIILDDRRSTTQRLSQSCHSKCVTKFS